LEVEEQLHKRLLQRLRRQSTWARHVEKAALVLDMVNVTLQKQSVTVNQAGMEFSVTPNIVKAGMAHWDQTALAMGFAMQENVSVPQVGVKILMQKTRLLQMFATTRFVQWVAGIMANASQVPVSASRVGQDQTVRILIAVPWHVADMDNVHSCRPMHLHNVCATTDGVAVSAIVKLCMKKCVSVPMTAVEMVFVLMANAYAMLALMDLTALVRSAQILQCQGPGAISHGAPMIALGRACA